MKPAEQASNHPAHETVWELLPWYHNDGLDTAQRALVDGHLRECLICRREVRQLRQLGMAIAAPANEQACAQAFQRLATEIDARRSSWRERLHELLVGLTAPASMLAAVAVIALCALLVWPGQRGDQAVSDGAEKQFQIDTNKFQQTILQARSDVSALFHQYDINEKSIRSSQLVLDKAQHQQDYSREMFRLGRITLLSMQQSSNSLRISLSKLAVGKCSSNSFPFT